MYTNMPMTVAVVLGLKAMMNCRFELQNLEIVPNDKAQWKFRPYINDTDRLIVEGCKPYNTLHFDVYDFYPEQCKLIIKEVSAEDAGVYTCYPEGQEEFGASAGLIVLASDPLCSQSEIAGEVGQTVNISCTVDFWGAIGPRWEVHDPNFPKAVSNISLIYTGYRSTAVATLVIYSPKVEPLTFVAIFTQRYPGAVSYNVPDYTYNWTSQLVIAMYAPGEVMITMSTGNTTLRLGDWLWCNATGVPSPAISWTDPWGRVTDGQKLIIIGPDGSTDDDDGWNDLRYVCKATNDYGSASKEISVDIVEFNNSGNIQLSGIGLMLVTLLLAMVITQLY